jgi:hypothetical protein
MAIPGRDQVNLPLPLTLGDAGLTNVSVTVDSVLANAVQLLIH